MQKNQVEILPHESKSYLNFLLNSTRALDKDGTYSVTTVLDSPRIYFLKKRHPEKVRYSTLMNNDALIGIGAHDMLAKNADASSIIEKRLERSITINNRPVLLYGTPDEIAHGGGDKWKLIDHKFWKISGYKYLLMGEKQEVVAQQNWYRNLAEQEYDINILSMQLDINFKDWSHSKYKIHLRKHRGTDMEKTYPKQAKVVQRLEEWEDDTIEAHMAERLTLFEEVRELPDEDMPLCSSSERWESGTFWKVYKYKANGELSKRAMSHGTFKAQNEAKLFKARQTARCEVKFIEGRNVRCRKYCPVAHLCSFGVQQLALENSDEF